MDQAIEGFFRSATSSCACPTPHAFLSAPPQAARA